MNNETTRHLMKCNFSYAKEVIFFVPETDDKV